MPPTYLYPNPFFNFIFIFIFIFITPYIWRDASHGKGIGWEGCVMWGLTYLLVCLLHVHSHVSKNNAAPFLKDVRFEADWRIAGRALKVSAAW